MSVNGREKEIQVIVLPQLTPEVILILHFKHILKDVLSGRLFHTHLILQQSQESKLVPYSAVRKTTAQQV